MKKINFIAALLLPILLFASCTGNAVYLKNNKSFTQTDPKTIKIYSITDPAVNYEVIGYVSTYTSDAFRDGDVLKKNLRLQASKYGANAIIGFKLNMSRNGGGGAQGVAVRYLP